MTHMAKLIVLRTEAAHFAAVVREQKHALEVQLDAGPVTFCSFRGKVQVSFLMECSLCTSASM
jgi:hypothetical protein